MVTLLMLPNFKHGPLLGRPITTIHLSRAQSVCVCETYIGKPFGTRVVPQFTTEVAKPLTQ
jgi:hypothetical protein